MTRGLVDFPNRANSLNALRLALATAVIVSHSWPIGGYGRDPQWGRMTLGTFAVAGFFAISGWLITQSRESTTLPGYLWRRFLRIYPGFLVALLVVAFAFGPAGQALGHGDWSVRGAADYVAHNAAVHISRLSVGSTPGGVPYPHDWDGSLWTLFYELLCYLLIGLVVTVAPTRAVPAVVLALFAATTVADLAQLPGLVGIFSSVAPYFMAGAVLYVFRGRVPLHWVVAAAAAVVAAVIIGVGLPPGLAALPLAYLMLWLGAALPLHRVGRRNDISYGMYIYAFPVQQILVMLGADGLPVGLFVVLSVLCTLPLAAASWVLVERPALRFKRLTDRRPSSATKPVGSPR